MPIADIFSGDGFSTVALSSAIQKLPVQPGKIGASGLFQDKGVVSPKLALEELNGIIGLVQTTPRGGTPLPASTAKRTLRTLTVPHLALEACVLADDVLGIRAFGSENSLQGVASVVNDRLSEMKQAITVTQEHMMISALQGTVLDADGSPIYDLNTEFGTSQQTEMFNLGDEDTDVKAKCIETVRKIEDALGASTYSEVQAYCGPDFFDALTSHDSVRAAFMFYNAQNNSADMRKGFVFAGIRFIEYRGTVSGQTFLPSDAAVIFPTGVQGMYLNVYAPADFVETVNTVGQSIYAKQAPMEFDRGIRLHVQSNVLSICTRPNAVVLASDSGSSPGPG